MATALRDLLFRPSFHPTPALLHFEEVGADLPVMGGHGHSRFREFVPGEATRSVPDRAELPGFLSH